MKRLFFTVLCLLFINKNALAVDPFLDWKTIESEHLFVHYAEGNKAIAERALAIAEAAHVLLAKELNWQPKEKTHVALSDETDFPNGFATPVFLNHTVIFLAPPTSVNTLEDFDDWFGTLILHEYTHIIHLDKSDGSPEYLRKIFGRFFFLFPNVFQPSWVTEGLATYKETYLDRGIGRGQSTMFASMMREEVANGLKPITHVNLPVSTWPAGTTRYLYGVYFMTFIAEEYGEEKLQQWVEEYSDNLIPFFINTNANQVLGKNLTALWQEFEQWLTDRFQPQIDAIVARGVVGGEQISREAYRTDSVRVRKTEQGDDIYYVRNSGYKRASLIRIRAGKTESLVILNGSANLDLHPQSGVLLTQDEFCNNYTVYKDIYRYDEIEDELTRLTTCGRYIFASWHPDGKQIIAVHHEAQRMALHLLDDQAKQQAILWQAENNEVIGQIDVAPDGKNVVASVWREGEGWNIELFNLESKQWKKITYGSNIEAYPQYTEQGNILFSQEADGVYNLRRYYIDSGVTEQLTNLIGGAFQSSQAGEYEPVYYTGYTAEGYAIFRLDATLTSISDTILDVLSEEAMATKHASIVNFMTAEFAAADTTADEPIEDETAADVTTEDAVTVDTDTVGAAAVDEATAEAAIAEDTLEDTTEDVLIEEAPAGDTPMEELLSETIIAEEDLANAWQNGGDSGGQLEIIRYDVTDHKERDYSALSNMYPHWWFPTFAFSDQRSELGITTSGADVLSIHQYSITASYDTKLNTPAGGLFYAYTDRFFASAQRTNQITLDADGNLERVSNRSVASAVFAFPNYYIQEQFNLLFAVVYDNTEDGDLFAGAKPSENFEDHLLGIAGLFVSSDLNPLSISQNDGTNIRLVAEDSDTLQSDFTGQVYTLDLRHYFRTGRESVLAFRFVQGWGTDNPKPFRLGGDGLSDNVLDIFIGGGGGQGIFDQRDYALRGYKEGHLELRGRRMQLLSGEWRFPFDRIEDGIMTPPIGIMQWFGNVFTEVGSAYQDSPESYYTSAGFELVADINAFYSLVIRTRLGYAHGFDKDIGTDQVYLKIGGSF